MSENHRFKIGDQVIKMNGADGPVMNVKGYTHFETMFAGRHLTDAHDIFVDLEWTGVDNNLNQDKLPQSSLCKIGTPYFHIILTRQLDRFPIYAEDSKYHHIEFRKTANVSL